MAKADRSSMGAGAQGKGDGSGAMTDLPEGTLGENEVLSNRDKSRHNDERGLDSRAVQTEQYQDHVANRTGGQAVPADGNTGGVSSSSMGASGEDGSIDREGRE